MNLRRAALRWFWRRLVSWLKLLLRPLKWLLLLPLLPLLLLWRWLLRLEPRMHVLMLRRMLRSLWRIRFRTSVMLLLIVVGYAMTTGHFGQAAAFLFQPDFSKLTTSGILVALGHAFFTLSLGMAVMMYLAYAD